MAKEHPSDKSGEDYLKFLEGLDDHALAALTEGKAVAIVVSAANGFDLLAPIITAEKDEPGSGEEPWEAHLQTLTDQKQGAQVAADLIHLKALIDVMVRRTMRRVKTLHMEVCEDCRREHEEGRAHRKRLKRGLEAAKAAFAEALEEDDEPWRASLEEDDDE